MWRKKSGFPRITSWNIFQKFRKRSKSFRKSVYLTLCISFVFSWKLFKKIPFVFDHRWSSNFLELNLWPSTWKKSKLKTNSFHKEKPNTRHYCIIFVFDWKLLKKTPLPFNRTMNSLVNPWQISSIACHSSLQFFSATIFSSVSSLMPWASCVFFEVCRFLHLKN